MSNFTDPKSRVWKRGFFELWRFWTNCESLTDFLNTVFFRFRNNFNIFVFKYVKGFKKRYPNISIHKPENTDLSKSTSINKINVMKSTVEHPRKTNIFTANSIFNLDETGVSKIWSPIPIHNTTDLVAKFFKIFLQWKT